MFLSRLALRMSGKNPPLNRLEQRATEADQIIEYLKQQVQLLKEKAILQASIREEKKLRVENAKLKKDIEDLKQQLLDKEKRKGVKPVAVPSADAATPSTSQPPDPEPIRSVSPSAAVNKDKAQRDGEDKKKKDKLEKKAGEKKKQPGGGEEEARTVDVSRLDLRVGRIVTAKKHPDADALYVEEVDVGEAAPRTVVSGLVKHVPLEQMQNRMAVLLCNLKPAKMRGVLSQAMVMCASSPDKVEILDPPSGAQPGDRISFEGFPGEPDKELNPKKKVWEQVQPDLRTDTQCVATYKGAPFEVRGKGVCKAQTMSSSGIK
ncbi:aminoacyl tRNA synthase complex-interacting multifunctional protein 1a isoform X1 [Amia ocellicauda]|uniref:aminoacyl tRNA synthase complex-interacting multifunctional protein 1a isoform X1 n=2 Tax=Amia ocellicauda TaxID=2972642 RepID=UPI0034643B11